ncbi:hypothetical protein C3L33_00206, partial [Rhododendron williamsianum]
MKSLLFMVYGCLAFVLLVHVQARSSDAGTNYNISSAYYKSDTPMQLSNLRSFPQGIRNCYTLPQDKGNKCLIRATFMYGNYDSKDQPPEFALYLDGDQWHTVRFNDASDVVRAEIIHNVPATSAYIHVCLVNTGRGTPFISALELRQLNNSIYQTHSGSLKLFNRIDVGSTTEVRYSDDVYDRIWFRDTLEITSTSLEVVSASYSNRDALSANDYKPPYPVMATAIRPGNGYNSLDFWVKLDYQKVQQLYVYMHFAEIAADQEGELDIYINDAPWSLGVATYFMRPVTVNSAYSMGADLQLNFSIRATAQSTLPPILNAIEVYEDDFPLLLAMVVEAIRNIKSAYRVERNWQGDPCVPMNYSWEVLQCLYDRNSARIISLNLSSSSLSGNMDFSFSGLTSLESLDLSNNNLTGQVPDFLSGLRFLKTFTEGNLHLPQAENPSKCQVDSCAKKKNFVVPAIASIASCLVIVVVILAIWWSLKIRKQQAKRQYTGDEMVEERKRQFTYSELETITENFLEPLGKGSFGSVYAGHLTDNTKVAVKILSLLSTQGSEQFRTEATIVVFSNKIPFKPTQYNIEFAALEYLHDGCKPPIIHRDIKTANILLTENMQAKVSDFGLSRLMPSDGGTHVSTLAAGTPGYIDPE